MQVGMAHARRGDLDEDLLALRRSDRLAHELEGFSILIKQTMGNGTRRLARSKAKTPCLPLRPTSTSFIDTRSSAILLVFAFVAMREVEAERDSRRRNGIEGLWEAIEGFE